MNEGPNIFRMGRTIRASMYSHHEAVGKFSESCGKIFWKTDEILLEAQFCENQTKTLSRKIEIFSENLRWVLGKLSANCR